MINKKELQRILSASLCRVEGYVLYGWTPHNKTLIATVSDGLTVSLPNAADQVSLEEFFERSAFLDMVRIDAITRASYPEDDPNGILDCFLPIRSRAEALNKTDTPRGVVEQLMTRYHLALNGIHIPSDAVGLHSELRFNMLPGSYNYEGEPTGLINVTDALCYVTPGGIVERNYSRISEWRNDDYSNDLQVWFNRGLLELLPGKYVQSIYYGDTCVTRTGHGLMQETICMSPFPDSDDIMVYFNLLLEMFQQLTSDHNVKALLAYNPRSDSSPMSARCDREQWAQATSYVLNGFGAESMDSLNTKLMLVKKFDNVYNTTDQLKALHLDNGNSRTRYNLVAQHDDDAISSLVEGAWE